MNLHLRARAASIACAFVFTLSMLVGVNGLATSDLPAPGQLAASPTASQPAQG
jgi:hypothetical protein